MGLAFTKLQGCGNDYIAIDGRGDPDRDWNQLCIKMSKHAYGVGSDGIVLALNSDAADIRMRVINPDGSEAEMSGNGIRLFTKFVIEHGIASPTDGVLRIETLGGVRQVEPRMAETKVVGARVAMGTVNFNADEVPVRLDQPNQPAELVAFPYSFGPYDLEITCLNIGNPHCVAVIERSAEEFPLNDAGLVVESHPIFPQRINFEVVNVLARDRIRARIYERGAGETLSSGTGSTASAAAARKLGLVGDNVDVVLDGGTLNVSFDEHDNAFLDGPAEAVFDGVWLPEID